MWNFPNIISLARLPLALLFIPDHLPLRIVVLILAFLSDGLDGYLARRYAQTTKLGALLDPMMDKFFVCCVMFMLWLEGLLFPWMIGALLSRDIAVIFYGAYLLGQRRLANYEVRAIWCGKITTCLQFGVFMAILCHMALPAWTYGIFITLGVCSLIELYMADKTVDKGIYTLQ